MADNGDTTLKALGELTHNMAKGIRKLPMIQDASAHCWALKIFDGFGPHTSSLKSMETYATYKVSMLKEEGNTSHVCQNYDQHASKKDTAIFRDNNYILRSWMTATRSILNYWRIVNVSLQAVNKLPR